MTKQSHWARVVVLGLTFMQCGGGASSMDVGGPPEAVADPEMASETSDSDTYAEVDATPDFEAAEQTDFPPDVCAPTCDGRQCGSDGCSGSCGSCAEFANSFCTVAGGCDCTPTCADGVCGPDGCGGTCVSCDGKECGDDGCGGTCGACLPGYQCVDYQCDLCLEPACFPCDDANEVEWDGCTAGNVSEFQINDDTEGDQNRPGVAAWGTDRFAVVWIDEHQDDKLMLKVYDDHAGPLFSTGLGVFPPLVGDGVPSLAEGPDGNLIVVWEAVKWEPEGVPEHDVVFVQIDPNGDLISEPRVLHDDTVGEQVDPDIARAPDGSSALVVWASYREPENPGAELDTGVFGRFFRDDGTESAEFRISTYSSQGHEGTSVAALSDGRFVVAWSSYGQDGHEWDVFFAIIGAAGAVLTPDVKANDLNFSYQWRPTVTTTGDGTIVVAWQGTGDTDYEGIYVRRFTTTGQPLSTPVPVETEFVEDGQAYPTIAADESGAILVAWDNVFYGPDPDPFNYDHDIRYSLLATTSAAPLGPARANRYTNEQQAKPTVAALPDGFVLTWETCIFNNFYVPIQDGDGCGVYGILLDKHGLPRVFDE